MTERLTPAKRSVVEARLWDIRERLEREWDQVDTGIETDIAALKMAADELQAIDLASVDARPGRCADCLYAQPLQEGVYSCRVRAPVVCPEAHLDVGRGGEDAATWPSVGPDDWCGNWRARA